MRNRSDKPLSVSATAGGIVGQLIAGELTDDNLELVVGGLARPWVDPTPPVPVELPMDERAPVFRAHAMSAL